MNDARSLPSRPLDSSGAAQPIAWLEVGHGHRVAWQESGACDGIPVVIVHGGPGSSSVPRHREMFDATHYRMIQLDQRGCGLSTPQGETAHNHTEALIGDMEALRVHLGIERWFVSGGSWGATLALMYAARYPERVTGMILRGSFLAGRADLDWFFHGVAAFAPEAQATFLEVVPRTWRRRVPAWLDRCFAADDLERQRLVAAAWQTYETRLDSPQVATVSTSIPSGDALARLVAKYRVQAHYLARRCFLGERAVLRAAASLRGVPVALVHGTRDLVCRPQNAWALHRRCVGSRIAWADGGGHDPFQPAAAHLLRAATHAFAKTGDFSQWPPTSVAPSA